jgi:hypothetical protein
LENTGFELIWNFDVFEVEKRFWITPWPPTRENLKISLKRIRV